VDAEENESAIGAGAESPRGIIDQLVLNANISNLSSKHAREQVIGVKDDIDSGRVKEDSRPTLFHHLLTPNPEEGYVVPTVDDIKDEAYGILAAAADTTGNGMTVSAYHVVNNPEIYKKLVTELRAAFPDPNERLDLQVLEKLPYLVRVLYFVDFVAKHSMRI
jgi:cytochrome P450